jgi:hypothetical protein
MFEEKVSKDSVAEYQMLTACSELLQINTKWVDWVATAYGGNSKFTATKSAGGSACIRTPLGEVFSIFSVIRRDVDVIGRVVFYKRLPEEFRGEPVPIFALRLSEGYEVRSGDKGERQWRQGRNVSYWEKSEAERLGYEILLVQMDASGISP